MLKIVANALPVCSRLRCLVKQLERGEASVLDLKRNLIFTATILEGLYMDETRQDISFFMMHID